MADETDYNLFKPKTFGFHYKAPKLQLHLMEQRLEMNPAYPSLWLAPESYGVRDFGDKEILKVIGKVIGIPDRKDYLTQTPAPIVENNSGLSLYTDNTPDTFTRNNQFSLGVKGFGFGSQGSFFVQGTSDRPGSNLYNSFQFNIVPGEIPLVVLRNISITPQIGVDMRAGNPSLGLQVNFKDFFLKSVNFGINNLSWDWKKKLGADSVQVVFEIPLPNFI
ncbi:MAG TPA: hypothetical protein VGZ71_07010 [Puia sp.]|jgi:hypothetical protein|nr:hypothetical protein [Puia sp.]